MEDFFTSVVVQVMEQCNKFLLFKFNDLMIIKKKINIITYNYFFYTRYLKCSNQLCGGTAKMLLSNIDVISINRQHDPVCERISHLENVKRFKHALKDALTSNWHQLKHLYDNMIAL